MQTRSFHKSDQPYPIANDATEWDRLDAMHNGLKEFLGSKLSFAPIEEPKKILEVGCGSGAWAIQAAQTYPDAEVIAIDISPIPARPVPDNLKFQQLNVTEPLPFEAASFDVIHIRFVLIHVPDFREVLKRLIDLVKPGGWVLAEDVDHGMHGDVGDGIKTFYEVYHGYTKQRRVNPNAGVLLEGVLKDSGVFSEVNVQETVLQFNEKHDDPVVGRLGRTMRLSFARAYQAVDPKLVEYGMTKEIQKGFYDEFEDLSRNIYTYLYFAWARKL